MSESSKFSHVTLGSEPITVASGAPSTSSSSFPSRLGSPPEFIGTGRAGRFLDQQGERLTASLLRDSLAGATFLPEGWGLCRDAAGRPLYTNFETGETSRKPPLEPSLRELADDYCRRNACSPEVRTRLLEAGLTSDIGLFRALVGGSSLGGSRPGSKESKEGSILSTLPSVSRGGARGATPGTMEAEASNGGGDGLATPGASHRAWAEHVLRVLSTEASRQPGRLRRKLGGQRRSTASIVRALGAQELLGGSSSAPSLPSADVQRPASGSVASGLPARSGSLTPQSLPPASCAAGAPKASAPAVGNLLVPPTGLRYSRSAAGSSANSRCASAARKNRLAVPGIDFTKVCLDTDDDDDDVSSSIVANLPKPGAALAKSSPEAVPALNMARVQLTEEPSADCHPSSEPRTDGTSPAADRAQQQTTGASAGADNGEALPQRAWTPGGGSGGCGEAATAAEDSGGPVVHRPPCRGGVSLQKGRHDFWGGAPARRHTINGDGMPYDIPSHSASAGGGDWPDEEPKLSRVATEPGPMQQGKPKDKLEDIMSSKGEDALPQAVSPTASAAAAAAAAAAAKSASHVSSAAASKVRLPPVQKKGGRMRGGKKAQTVAHVHVHNHHHYHVKVLQSLTEIAEDNAAFQPPQGLPETPLTKTKSFARLFLNTAYAKT